MTIATSASVAEPEKNGIAKSPNSLTHPVLYNLNILQ
jgi:hypothetical protein